MSNDLNSHQTGLTTREIEQVREYASGTSHSLPPRFEHGAGIWHAVVALCDAAAQAWRPMDTAPKDGTEVLLYCPGEAGTGRPLVGHYTQGGGEEQPRFGPAWFVWTGFSFRELPGAPSAWAPIPPLAEARSMTRQRNG